MIKSLGALCAVSLAISAVACRDGASEPTPIIPTIGTVATVQGTVMRAGTSVALPGVTISIGGVRLITGIDGTYAVSGLKPGAAVLTAQRQGFETFAEQVSLEGARTYNIFLSPSGLPQYGGSWTGRWITGAKTGGLVMTVGVDTIAEAMRVALDIGGNIVGDFDPPGETYVGTISGSTVHFSQASPVFGNIAADLSADGQIAGTVTRVPLGDVLRFNFNGTITSSSISINYVITFNDSTTQTGSATFTR